MSSGSGDPLLNELDNLMESPPHSPTSPAYQSTCHIALSLEYLQDPELPAVPPSMPSRFRQRRRRRRELTPSPRRRTTLPRVRVTDATEDYVTWDDSPSADDLREFAECMAHHRQTTSFLRDLITDDDNENLLSALQAGHLSNHSLYHFQERFPVLVDNGATITSRLIRIARIFPHVQRSASSVAEELL